MKELLEKQLENAYKIFKNDHERLRKNMIDSIREQQVEYEPEPEQTIVPNRKSSGPSIGEIIMNNRIFKIAAGIIIVGIIAITLKILTGTNTVASIAFGDVLEHIHGKSYTFDMSFVGEDQVQGTNKCMMLQPGIVRIDTPEIWGGITSLSNFNTGDRVMIIHGQKTVMNLKDIPEIGENAQDIGPFAMLANPIENLWNLQDGTETVLEKKEIDGQSVIGFKVAQNSEEYPGDIIVWANSETGCPIRVEINLYNPENTSEAVTILLNNFDLDVELDPALFSMDIPEGYTMAYQKTLDETVQENKLTLEAGKIEQSIKLWSSGDQDKAVELLLNIDWTQTFDFSGDMYFFYLKEKEYVRLKQEDQQKVSQEIMDMSTQLRNLCRKVWELSEAAVTQGNYETSEKYLTTTLELGKLINRDPELAYTPQMIGHALIKKSLTESEKLYKASNNQEKLQQTQNGITEIDSEIENLRNLINNM